MLAKDRLIPAAARDARNVPPPLPAPRSHSSYATGRVGVGEEERRSALRALRLIRRVYPVLPTRLRYAAPYHEALGRLGGRSRPDLMTRWLNYLWIGRECMAD